VVVPSLDRGWDVKAPRTDCSSAHKESQRTRSIEHERCAERRWRRGPNSRLEQVPPRNDPKFPRDVSPRLARMAWLDLGSMVSTTPLLRERRHVWTRVPGHQLIGHQRALRELRARVPPFRLLRASGLSASSGPRRPRRS
jgi:hypothetical protein